MSHYPSSAELAAFRRAAYRGTPHGAIWGALPSERKLGIGNGPEIWNGAEDRWPSNVRREASALRSRAYHRMARDCDARWMLPALDLLNPDGSYFGPWFEEAHFGVPYTFHPSYLPA